MTGVETGHRSELPSTIQLLQNYPNPFNPSTAICYRLSVAGDVKLSIYNLLGQRIKTLVDYYQGAGEHLIVWNGADDSNCPVSSGIYVYKIETHKMRIQKKMILIR